MKRSVFFLILILVSCIFTGCINKMASRIIDLREVVTLKLLENPKPEEEAELHAQLADIYNAKAQYFMVNQPEQEEEANNWLQQSIEQCNFVMQQWPNDYANDEFVSIKINLTMANNLFLMGNQEEANQWCSRLLENVDCPQVLKELR